MKSVFAGFLNVETAILYGSRASGKFRTGSDIDLTSKGKSLDLALMNRLRTVLDDLMLPYLIDLSAYDQIQNEDLIEHIDRVGIQFYP